MDDSMANTIAAAIIDKPIPIKLDIIYNLAVCSDCCIGLPFEWIAGHLKDNHGLKTDSNEIIEYLNINKPFMTL